MGMPIVTGMPVTIQFPPRKEMLAFNRERYDALCADPYYGNYPFRVETDRNGYPVMSPPPSRQHSERQSEILLELNRLLGPHARVEVPISTVDGVKAADVAWCSPQRYADTRGPIFETAPEICVEVLSRGNSATEMAEKRTFYFDAGALECWECGLDGKMSFFLAEAPGTRRSESHWLPAFPKSFD